MRQQLADLREAMAARGIDIYLVVTDDFHASEYTGAYFKCREHLTGFTGSAGTAVVTAEEAGLWTDGRYFLQAEAQLKDSGFALRRMGDPGVPAVEDYIRGQLTAGRTLAFDGRTVSARAYRAYQEMAEKAGASVLADVDLAGEIWPDRPALSAEPAWELDIAYAGRGRKEKLADLRKELAEQECDGLILSSLMDINWLFNLRGNDVACTPVALSFALITAEEARLYINPAILPETLKAALAEDDAEIRPYEAVYEDVKALPAGMNILIDPEVVNSRILVSIPSGVRVTDGVNPTVRAKAVKNETEVANFRLAHLRDGVAVTRFMRWVKENAGRAAIDELSAAEKLEEFRREQEHYVEPSFDAIMGYGPHGAIIHYKATPETCIPLEPRGFLLSDTGGHYLEGTTDITRTYALGPLTEEEKKLYTLVLKGHLGLGAAVFREGTTGYYLDYIARKPLMDAGYDYNHGTGHGVGYLMSVHEGPQSISFRLNPRRAPAPLEVGMVTSDEPGVYLPGRFGVRLENLTVVREAFENEFGKFLKFEYLTMVPWDLDAVLPELLTESEKQALNAYHARVREALSPRMTEDEQAWLAHATREI